MHKDSQRKRFGNFALVILLFFFGAGLLYFMVGKNDSDIKTKTSAKKSLQGKTPSPNILVETIKEEKNEEDVSLEVIEEKKLQKIETENPSKEFEEMMVLLEKDYNHLRKLSSTNHIELYLFFRKIDRNKQLTKLFELYKTEEDSSGKKKKRLDEIDDELRSCQGIINHIESHRRRNTVRRILEEAEVALKEMVKSYEKGRETSDSSLFEKVIVLGDKTMPFLFFSKNTDLDYPLLPEFREKMNEYREKAETQIAILALLKKLELKLEGIIFVANNPESSVAFINNKAFRKDDIVKKSFVVHMIKKEEVILSFRGELVLLRLKKENFSTKEKLEDK